MFGRFIKLLKDNSIMVAVILGIVLVVVVYGLCTARERSDADKLIDETIDFMVTKCVRYDTLIADDEADMQIQVLDKAKEIKRCNGSNNTELTSKFLTEFAEEQRLSGIIVTDKDANIVNSVKLDDGDYDDWNEILKDDNVIDVAEYSQKSYVSQIELDDGSIYIYAAVATADMNRIIICYVHDISIISNNSQDAMESLMIGYNLDKQGIVLVTGEGKVLTSNDESLIGKAVEDVVILQDSSGYTGRRGKYKTYDLYVFFPNSQIYKNRLTILAIVFAFYALISFIIAIVRQQEMRRSSNMKMEFLRKMSHDIRTPINGIRGMIHIGDKYPEDMKQQEYCRNKIWDASVHLISIVDDVLDMGKLESGKMVFDEKPFNLKSLIEDTREALSPTAGEAGIAIELGELEGENWNLIGSKVNVERILNNLISNAVKYNNVGGSVTISCNQLDSSDSINDKDRDDKEEKPATALFQIAVADTGIGMSEEFQKHMFDQFSQENAKSEVRFHGTGLGLSIVKSLVEEMKGTIDVISVQGEGSTFTITLPFTINEKAELESQRIEEVERGTLEGCRILLAEDNDLNMEIARFLLEEQGATVIEATNGQEALETFQNSELGYIQLILMDIMMPVMDGEEATIKIRALDREDAKTIPIIAMTANVYGEDIKSVLDIGMNDHIGKPIDVQSMNDIIKKYI